MTPEELTDLIKKLESAGYQVLAVVSDLDGANRSVPTQLGATLECPRFPNPARPGHYIYYLFDPVHVIKLIRTHLVRTGFKINGYLIGGQEIFDEFMKKLEESKKNSDIRIAPKLTPRHVEFKNQDCQNVRLACELLSTTTANTMELLYPGNENFKKLSNLIRLFDN